LNNKGVSDLKQLKARLDNCEDPARSCELEFLFFRTKGQRISKANFLVLI
jgi:hypothetical protein